MEVKLCRLRWKEVGWGMNTNSIKERVKDFGEKPDVERNEEWTKREDWCYYNCIPCRCWSPVLSRERNRGYYVLMRNPGDKTLD